MTNAEKFEEVWGVDLEAHLDELMDFVKEQETAKMK